VNTPDGNARSLEVWLNGQFVRVDEAKVSAFDAGFQHSVGLFETLTARNGTVFRPRAHVSRLERSARELLLLESLRADALVEAIGLTVSHNQLQSARVRLTVTGGSLNLRVDQPGHADPTILIHAQPPTSTPSQLREQGIRVAVADDRLSPLDASGGVKTLNYWMRLLALQKAGAVGASESLWFTVSNHLAGGSTSNALLFSKGVLLTPFARGEEPEGALASPVRPGVTREVVLELARQRGISVECRPLDITDVLEADELMLTNSGWGVLPVVAVEQATIGSGSPGELTQILHEDLEKLIEQETSYGLDPSDPDGASSE
jgi:branched-subunit amino acid aminotransferase/4-amino-4-deoxychorismate lyase